MRVEADIGVVGGGPAGLAAACAAARLGARVIVIDENTVPGGQLVKQIHKFFGSFTHGAGVRGVALAAKLVEEAKSLGVVIISGAVVHAAFKEGREVEFHDDRSCHALAAKRLIVAAGASENALAFPGWTLPGVMSAGALQTMMNIHRVLPARRILMVGAGNVGLIVSYQAIQAGAEMAAVLEAEPEIGGYAVHAAKLERLGVPILTRTTLSRASGGERVRRAQIVSLSPQRRPVPGSERWIETDLVCLAVGLSPLVELPAMAGCRLEYLPELGGFVPWHDGEMRTSLPNVYIAGDVSGIEEASTAMEQGRLAGIGAAESLGLVDRASADGLRREILASLGELRSGPRGERVAAAKARLAGGGPPAAKVPPGPCPAGPPVRAGDHARPVAVIECHEHIPCDPCVSACPFGAITMEGGLSGLPRLDGGRCTGCGSCIPRCPGLAIYVLNACHGLGTASIAVPYEFHPRPEIGERVRVVDRKGSFVCGGRVIKIAAPPAFDRTPVVTVEFPARHAGVARYFRRYEDGRVS